MGSDAGQHDAPLRVLIVDDEPDVLLLLRVQMEGRPDVELLGTATDGQEAIEACRDLQPEAVVMDLLMPRMTGFDAIEVLRKDMPELGIVAHSALTSESVREQMNRLGVPLVVKSGDVEPLIEALGAAAGRGVAK